MAVDDNSDEVGAYSLFFQSVLVTGKDFVSTRGNQVSVACLESLRHGLFTVGDPKAPLFLPLSSVNYRPVLPFVSDSIS